MKILSIAGILPIPGLLKGNDFVFQTYIAYRNQYINDQVVILRSTQYKTNLKKLLNKDTELNKINKKYTWNIYDFRVEILPYFSSRLLRDLHPILTSSIYWLNRKRISKLFKEYNFDVIHAQYIFPDGLLAYILHKRYKIPYTLTSHNELYYLKFPFSRFIGKKILKNAYKVLPINYRNLGYYANIGLNNIEILPLGFNKSFIRDQKVSQSSTINILTACELIPLKNVDKVILSIAELVKDFKIKYTIIGRGPEKERLAEMITQLQLNEYIELVDHVPHEKIADEMHRHDIFIMPSYIETFGRVYFEAMAMGIPIICAKNSGIYGYYKDLEEGVTVIHTDITDITEKLRLLITDSKLRQSIGLNGQNLVRNYTWDNVATRLREIYLDACEQNK
jgi:glycosyltransferase involved in cell wall biosynthesis